MQRLFLGKNGPKLHEDFLFEIVNFNQEVPICHQKIARFINVSTLHSDL
jgi:hypothetical protein